MTRYLVERVDGVRAGSTAAPTIACMSSSDEPSRRPAGGEHRALHRVSGLDERKPGASFVPADSMPPRIEVRPAVPALVRPASRDGVSASCVSLAPGDRRTVLEFLVARFPYVDAADWRARLRAGDVFDDRGRAVEAGAICGAHPRLHYFRSVADEPVLALAEELIYRDARIAVFDKPHGLAVMPAGRHLRETLLTRVRRLPGCEAAVPVHRIDRDTAGLVLFSLQPDSRDAYHALFRNRQVDKRYDAVARLDPALRLPSIHRSRLQESATCFMQMSEVPGEPNTETGIDLLGMLGTGLGHYELRPLTGARHQLRVHMASLGLPIVNDRIYPVLHADAASDPLALERQRREPLQLLARHLAFVDPQTGVARAFESSRRLALVECASAPA